MDIKKIIAILIFIGVFTMRSFAGDNIIKETYLYSVQNGDSLFLDKYSSVEKSVEAEPCVIFMFGGGFVSGVRDHEDYIPYFRFLVESGYKVVSIDYRLGMRPVLENPDMSARVFIGTFINAIYMATEDLFDATSFVYENAGEWGIDRKMIIANGSSAGAVSVLQGAYLISNGKELGAKLPAGFNYAGVISFAGAIFEHARDINFVSLPCPILMYHGDADSNVPYDKLTKLGLGFFGSKYIAKKLDAVKSPYWLTTYENFDHTIAIDPMDNNRQEILLFLDHLVKQQKPLAINNTVKEIGIPVKKKKFKLMDYVKANFVK